MGNWAQEDKLGPLWGEGGRELPQDEYLYSADIRAQEETH